MLHAWRFVDANQACLEDTDKSIIMTLWGIKSRQVASFVAPFRANTAHFVYSAPDIRFERLHCLAGLGRAKTTHTDVPFPIELLHIKCTRYL